PPVTVQIADGEGQRVGFSKRKVGRRPEGAVAVGEQHGHRARSKGKAAPIRCDQVRAPIPVQIADGDRTGFVSNVVREKTSLKQGIRCGGSEKSKRRAQEYRRATNSQAFAQLPSVLDRKRNRRQGVASSTKRRSQDPSEDPHHGPSIRWGTRPI